MKQTNAMKIYDQLMEERTKGNICFFASPDDLMVVNLDEFVKQHVDGMLYDLNRDEVTVLHFIKQGDMKWVNNLAVAQVIRKLKSIIDTLEQKNKQMTDRM